MEETAIQKYDLSVLSEDKDYTFLLHTRSNTIVPLNLKAIQNLYPPVEGKRPPNYTECFKLLNVSLGQGADPYANECGLLPVFSGGFRYEVWVAAQVRMRKALSQPDYQGFDWGYITEDFVRHQEGANVDPSKVVGLWGKVYRAYRKPFHHEVWLNEVKRSESDKSSWGKSPIMMMLKVLRDQAHKFAYADVMGNLNTEDELRAYNELPAPNCETPPREERRKVVESVDTLSIYNSVYQKFTEILKTQGYHEEDIQPIFIAFCVSVLMCKEEDVDKPEKFNKAMLLTISKAVAELEKGNLELPKGVYNE